MEKIDIEAFKQAGFSYEEIEDIIESEKEFKQSGVAYDLDEAFLQVRNNLFSKNDKCTK